MTRNGPFAENHEAPGEGVAPRRFLYRSRLFDEPTPRERILRLLANSPYFLLAAAFNASLLGFATISTLDGGPGDSGSGAREIVTLASATKEPGGRSAARQAGKGPIYVVPAGSDERDGDRARETHVEFLEMEPDTVGRPAIVVKEVRDDATSGSPPRSSSNVGRASANGSHVFESTTHGLSWLARHQDADGSWSPDGFTKNCSGGTVCEHSKNYGSEEYRTGVTALAILAFLSCGMDDLSVAVLPSPDGRSFRTADVIKKGLRYLRDRQSENGSFVSEDNHKWGYNHSIATLAMCEAWSLSRRAEWKLSAQRAVDHLIAGQNPAPGGAGLRGWRYLPHSGDHDISVTGWAVTALASAEMSGLRVARESLEGALQFCHDVTDPATGNLGYMRREDAGVKVTSPRVNEHYQNHPTFAAVGMCIRNMVARANDDPANLPASRLLIQDLPRFDKVNKTNDYYYWYYSTKALFQYNGPRGPRSGGGELWKAWNSALRKALLENQCANEKLCSSGSFDGDDRWGVAGGGRVYATAINVMTLQIAGR